MTLLEDLKDWRGQMPQDVRLVFDHDDAWQHIVAMAERATDNPESMSDTAQASQTQVARLRKLGADLGEIDEKLPDWSGSARLAFDETITALRSRVETLTQLGEHSARLIATAGTGHSAHEQFIHDMVQTAVDYAIRTYHAASALRVATAGMSMTNWATSNLGQVGHLVRALSDAEKRMDNVIDQVGYLIGELTDSTTIVTEQLTRLDESLRS